MCFSNEETVIHLFSHCMVWKSVLDLICDQFQLTIPPRVDTISIFMDNWVATYPRHSVLYYIPHHMMWEIWKAQNHPIFEGKNKIVLGIFQQIMFSTQLNSSQPVIKACHKKVRQIGLPPSLTFPCGFFDGASTSSAMGVGYSSFLNESHHLEFALGVGYGSNTKAELLGLWDLLLSSQMMGIPLSHIFDDS